MGEKLARKILRRYPNHDIDVVIPVPDTSRTSALQLSYILKLPYREGFIKNIDDFGKPSSSFTVCSFWFAYSLFKIGEKEK